MALVNKQDPKKIFASQAPSQDVPAEFNNYERGWDESRKNNGKPTIKQSNKLQQLTDEKILWMHQNGAALPFDETMEYAEGAVVVKDGDLQQLKDGNWKSVSGHKGVGEPYQEGETYDLGDEVRLENGELVRSTVAGNTNNPNADMTGWRIIPRNQVSDTNDLRKYQGRQNGQLVVTQSYYSGESVGGAEYQWDNTSTLEDDGIFTFAVDGVVVGRWKLVINNNAVNAAKIGIKGGLISSLVAADYTDHIKMQALIDYFSSIGGGTIYVNGGKTYQWNVQHKSKVKIIGLGSDGLKPTIRCRDVSNTHLFTMAQPDCYLENFNLNGYDSREILQTGGSGNIGAFSGVACQSTNLILKNITATRCRMDGVYMNSGANDVHVYNLDSRFHARNTVSITNAWNVHFYNPIVEQRAAIQPFAYNFDIEPDTGSTQTVYDIHIHNPVMLGEGQLLLKEENTPNGRMDVHIYYPQMDIPIRLNSAVHGLYIYGGKFTKGLFVAEAGRPGTAVDGFIDGAVISGSPFVQTTVTIGGDFVLRNNTINELAEGSPSRTQGTWENNTFGAGVTPVANTDRRTLTLPYREKALLEIVSPTGALSAYNTTEVRQVNLTTTPTPILTAKNRSTSIITIAAADASAGGSIGLVELVISSDDTVSTTFATDKINGAAGINYSWSGRTLSLATKAAAANQWIVKVETFANSSNQKQVAWLV